MLKARLILLLLAFFLAPRPSFSRAPYALRISCGARDDVHSSPTNTFWNKDFAYTGGIPANATPSSFISPSLNTLRYFPLSEGPENCYGINRVPHGHYVVRIYFGLVAEPSFDNEPLFDVSIEGTLIYSLPSGWSNHDDERAFVEALIFLKDGTASLCFHSTGHGDPAILAIEILQIDNRAYYFVQTVGVEIDSGTPSQHLDKILIKSYLPKAALNRPQSPNFYPEALYQTALISTDTQPDLAYTMEVEPNRNYSLWLHFAEIDPSVTGAGQRVFDILLNGITFPDVDIFSMARGVNTALVLNTTVVVSGRSLTITLHPTKGNHALINAIELLELVLAESKTLPDEIKALQKLKSTLGLPLRLGWNGDPCVPEQHPWSGIDCQYDRSIRKHVIDGLISGVIPSSLGTITSLEILDLSFNSFNGSIPESLGQLTSLRILDLNGNSLSGKVPAALGGRLLHGASFNFTDNSGLCGIPGLPQCGPHLSAGAKVGIALGACVAFLLIATCLTCWWKRRQNILRAQRIAARDAPYAKARTQFNREVQMGRHHSQEHARTAAENGPSLLA
ncbi:Receptor-like protein 4 [Sesamum angolense]|uniref:Receptor-like protein 4 n=1 Tax=Sesamum angolense TaxID=2727404 RepID=A0AAE1WT48_9LAMI|nr:Receptor-like protein 4 [Sesamum angolense]